MPPIDRRPIWEQLNITKVKRGSDTVFTMDNYEIVMRYEDSDYGPEYSLKYKDETEEIELEYAGRMAQFIECVAKDGYHIPFPPIPTENELKIKDALARLELVKAREHEIRQEIERLKKGYES